MAPLPIPVKDKPAQKRPRDDWHFWQNEAKITNNIKVRSGNSQAVQSPKEFHFDSEEVQIFRRGEGGAAEKSRDMQRAYQLLTELPEDFLRDGRNDIPSQTRKRYR
jgi:antitoxin VapB